MTYGYDSRLDGPHTSQKGLLNFRRTFLEELQNLRYREAAATVRHLVLWFRTRPSRKFGPKPAFPLTSADASLGASDIIRWAQSRWYSDS